MAGTPASELALGQTMTSLPSKEERKSQLPLPSHDPKVPGAHRPSVQVIIHSPKAGL